MGSNKLLKALVVCSAFAAPLSVNAQDSASRSWLPFTDYGYVGASVGQAEFDTDCVAGFSCDDNDTSFKIFTGGRIRNVFGVELAYVDMGEIERAGGTTEARGVNLSAVGYLPLNERFSFFGKVGTTYGWTDTSAAAGFDSGEEKDFGLSYGVGLNVELVNQWAARAEWERHNFEFAQDDDDIDLFTVGVSYKF
jgi:OmpA-OmpF porin, OOP family